MFESTRRPDWCFLRWSEGFCWVERDSRIDQLGVIKFVFHSQRTADYRGDTVRQSPATSLGDAGARRASFKRCPGCTQMVWWVLCSSRISQGQDFIWTGCIFVFLQCLCFLAIEKVDQRSPSKEWIWLPFSTKQPSWEGRHGKKHITFVGTSKQMLFDNILFCHVLPVPRFGGLLSCYLGFFDQHLDICRAGCSTIGKLYVWLAEL